MTLIPSRLRLFVTIKLLPERDLDVAPQQQLSPHAGAWTSADQCALCPVCSQLLQPVSTDFRPHSALTLHTSWTFQEVIAAEVRVFESINYKVGTYTLADWVHLLATALLSLKAEQLRQRTPSVVRSPHSSSPPSLLMSRQVEHSVSLQALLGTLPLRWTSH